MFRSGICPDCGSGIYQGMQKCRVCDLDFAQYAHELPAQKSKPAAPPPAPPQAAPPQAAPPQAAPPQYAPPPQGYGPPPQGYGPPPSAPPQAPRGGGSGGPVHASLSPIPSAQPIGKPLTSDDIDDLERGSLRPSSFPLTDAEGFDYVRGTPDPMLGSSLSRAAIVVMADAAVVDDPLTLLGMKPTEGHIVRAGINYKRSVTAECDEPQEILLSRTAGNADAAKALQPAPTSRSAHAAENALPAGPNFAPAPAARPDHAVPTPDGPRVRGDAPVETPRRAALASAQNTGKPLSHEEMERIERPVLTAQPHSFAEAHDFVFGAPDPLLGACQLKGANVVMADAAVVDQPLVLLGYPVEHNHVARMSINLRRADAAVVDDVVTLLQRAAPTQAPAAPPSGAPAQASAQGAPQAVRRPADPDATALLDQNAIRAAQAAVAEEEARAQQQRRPPTSVAARGGVRPLDEK